MTRMRYYTPTVVVVQDFTEAEEKQEDEDKAKTISRIE